MAEARTGDAIETSEFMPVFVDVAGPRGEDGYRPVVTQRLAQNTNSGIWRYDDGRWEMTAKGRRLGFIQLTKFRTRANGAPVYLDDRCKALAEHAAKRAAERKAQDEYERGVARATKTGSPKPTRQKPEEVRAAVADLVERGRLQAEQKVHPPAPDAPPDPGSDDVDLDAEVAELAG